MWLAAPHRLVDDEAMRGANRTAEAPGETFEAFVFDWDGTAVPDRRADASRLRHLVQAHSAAGVHVFVVSGADVDTVDDQLKARPQGRGRLHLCCNQGSEVYEVTGDGPVLVFRRTASSDEDRALDSAAQRTLGRLAAGGLAAQMVPAGPNHRKIDLMPLPEWEHPEKADPTVLIRAVLARLAHAGIGGLDEVVAFAADATRSAGIADPRITNDLKHVEIGLTDNSDAVRFAATWLAERGITGRLVLIGGDAFGSIAGVAGSDSVMIVDALSRAVIVSVGTEPEGVPNGVIHLGGGPARFLEVLDTQLARRRARRVPNVDLDPSWVLALPADPAHERVAESLATLGNGLAGTRGAREEDESGESPLFLVSGIYTEQNTLLPGPTWTGLTMPLVPGSPASSRVVDLHTGTLLRVDGGAGLRSMRFVSVASPHALALRAEALESGLKPGDPLRAPREGVDCEQEQRGHVHLARTGHDGAQIATAARDHVASVAGLRVVERLAAWVATSDGTASFDDAVERLTEVDSLGFDALLAGHRQAWAQRWTDASVVIDGDPESELAARFAVFQLLSTADHAGEVALGARGLTGEAYSGHVFWDSDVFVLPVLAAIRPATARAILEYRIRRLPAARAAARAKGLNGARFPWESAGDGSDVTPRWVRGPGGEPVPIATGSHEEHIVADVAWSANRYAAWTGDSAFLAGPGRDLIIDTARYWASRVRRSSDGLVHLYGVMGPDEYHQVVDDNAFTNVMARWNLRRGAELLAAGDHGSPEPAHWRDLADALVDGWDPRRQLYEQFAGYFALEPLLVSQIAPPPVAADVVMGAEHAAGSQIIKQSDVLMLHHLVPEEVVEGSLGSCLAFYEPRTAHGSSLSPAVSASLLARAGEPERALGLFRIAARIDLDDLTGTTAGGLHLAAMGGVWLALAYGFLGLRAVDGALLVDPHLPETWRALGLTFRFGGRPVGIRAEHDRVVVTCDTPIDVHVDGLAPRRCQPPVTVISSAPTGPGHR